MNYFCPWFSSALTPTTKPRYHLPRLALSPRVRSKQYHLLYCAYTVLFYITVDGFGYCALDN